MAESSVADMEATPAVRVVAYSNFWPVPPAMVASGQPGKIKGLGWGFARSRREAWRTGRPRDSGHSGGCRGFRQQESEPVERQAAALG